jgi:hypothetical protein
MASEGFTAIVTSMRCLNPFGLAVEPLGNINYKNELQLKTFQNNK